VRILVKARALPIFQEPSSFQSRGLLESAFHREKHASHSWSMGRAVEHVRHLGALLHHYSIVCPLPPTPTASYTIPNTYPRSPERPHPMPTATITLPDQPAPLAVVRSDTEDR